MKLKIKTKRKFSFVHACRMFPNRFTMEHIPFWAHKPMPNGRYYAPQFRSDQEWYDNVKFFGEDGWQGEDKNYCFTIGETWPLGIYLLKPYEKSTQT